MQELISVALITILAVISPGADFAMVTRNSYLYGRKAGLFTTLGIGLGVQVHVFYTIIGVGILIATKPSLFSVFKFLGAAYLIYVGYQTFTSKPMNINDVNDANEAGVTHSKMISMGFFTNALNPKTTLFVLSTYTQIISPQTPIIQQYAYGLFMSAAHWIWFAAVCVFFSTPKLRQKMLNQQKQVNQIIGLILGGLGCLLAVSSFSR